MLGVNLPAGDGRRIIFVMEIKSEVGLIARASNLEGNLSANTFFVKERIDSLQQK